MPTPVELVYGRSGTGKTNWTLELAEHIWKTRQKKTRIYMGDGGVQTALDYITRDGENLYELGALDIYQYNIHSHPFETCSLITQGYWPENLDDPDSKLLAPDLASLPNTFGMFVFEGLTAMCEYLMGYIEGGLSEQAARPGIKLGGGLDAPFKVTDGSITLGGVSQSGYGFVQRLIKTLIEQTRVLSPLVYWTAHQREVEDVENKTTIIGPNVAGKALTTLIGASFGNTIHLDTVSKTRKVKEENKVVEDITIERRAYWKEHFDPDARNFVKYYANCRMREDRVAEAVREEFKRGWMSPPDPVRFYSLLASGRKKNA